MLPRPSAVRRVVGVLGLATFITWLWIITPAVLTPSDFHGVLPEIGVGGLMTRVNTLVQADDKKKPEQTHHHSDNNQTLLKIRSNMTILKVNNTDLKKIMKQVNDSKQPEKEIKLPNPHPFKYIIFTDAPCRNKDVFVIAYIHTAPSHYKRRMVIRNTWGNPRYYPDVIIKVVFVMGKTNDKPEVQQALLFESEQYGDLVQEDFQDTYKNLTYKGVAALKWITNHCSHAKFVLKTDDDIFVNMFTLLKHLQSLYKLGVNNRGLLMCLVWYRMKVMRSGKWKIEKEQWKDDFYPTYCSGSAFTMSTDVAVSLHNASYHVPFFWVDDFYITGLLPLKAGNIKHKQFMSTYVLDGRKLEQKFTGPQWFTYIFSHVHDLNKVQSVWERLVKMATGGKADMPKVEYKLAGQLPKKKKVPTATLR